MNGVLRGITRRAGRPQTARAMEFVFQGLTLAGLIAIMVGLVLFALSRQGVDAAVVLAILAGAIAAAGWLAVLSTLADLSGQHARDLRAKEILDALQSGREPPPFTLYLRPFAATDMIDDIVMESVSSVFRGPLIVTSTRLELEQQIERAARPLGQLVALGKPLEHVGAGRIEVKDEGWQDVVRKLFAHARLIVLLPSSRLGTRWEIDQLLSSSMIERTVIVDPPNPRNIRSRRYQQSAEWREVRAAFARKGYEIPQDSTAGQLLFYGGQRSPQAHARLDMNAEENITRFFRTVAELGRPAVKGAA